MKTNCKTQRFWNSLIYALGMVAVTASTAFANNAPGPLAFASILSLVMLIVLLTFAGGGYSVAKRLNEAKYPSKTKRIIRSCLELVAGVALFFIGIMSTVIGVLGFALYAIARGVKMIKWGRDAARGETMPAHLEGANPRRLKTAGSILIAMTLLVLGYSTLHIDEVAGISDYKKKGRASALNADARNAHTAAMAFFEKNQKARVVTCADLEKMGYQPSHKEMTSCFSDMTASSGEIRISGPESWGLRKPVAIITYSGQLTRAEP